MLSLKAELTTFAGELRPEEIRSAVLLGLIGFVAVAGIVAYYASKLPPMADWTVPARPANVRIVAENGTLITNRGGAGGSTLTLDEMPPYLPEAVISIEDRRFYHHFGIDPLGLFEVAAGLSPV